MGVREPDPLLSVRDLRAVYPQLAFSTAILHSANELTGISLSRATRELREAESLPHSELAPKRTLLIDQPGRRLVVNGISRSLSPAELRLFLFLLRYCGIGFSREELLHRTRSSERAVDPRLIDVLIRSLRAKVDNGPPGASLFTTLYGIGYRFMRRDVEFIDGFTGRSFESWPSRSDTVAAVSR